MTTITPLEDFDFEERSNAQEGQESDEDLSSVHSGDSAPYIEAKKARAARWVKDTEEDRLEAFGSLATFGVQPSVPKGALALGPV